MLKHNTYFDGKVQSIGFERNGRRATAGVIDAGTFHFGTDATERMTVVSGELWVKLAGDEAFRPYAAGTANPANATHEMAPRNPRRQTARTPRPRQGRGG